MTYAGEYCEACLRFDGKLHWSDGDVWAREKARDGELDGEGDVTVSDTDLCAYAPAAEQEELETSELWAGDPEPRASYSESCKSLARRGGERESPSQAPITVQNEFRTVELRTGCAQLRASRCVDSRHSLTE